MSFSLFQFLNVILDFLDCLLLLSLARRGLEYASFSAFAIPFFVAYDDERPWDSLNDPCCYIIV